MTKKNERTFGPIRRVLRRVFPRLADRADRRRSGELRTGPVRRVLQRIFRAFGRLLPRNWGK